MSSQLFKLAEKLYHKHHSGDKSMKDGVYAICVKTKSGFFARRGDEEIDASAISLPDYIEKVKKTTDTLDRFGDQWQICFIPNAVSSARSEVVYSPDVKRSFHTGTIDCKCPKCWIPRL